MRKHIKFPFIVAAGIGMLLLQACNKLLSVPANAAGQIVTSQVFSDSLNATEGVLGLYSSSVLGTWYPDIYGGLGADELLNNSVYNTTAEAYYRDSLYAGSSIVTSTSSSFWDSYYGNTCIYLANAALEALAVDSQLSTSYRNQLQGECTFMRAFYYFYLVNRFGNVPYVTSTNYAANQRLPATSASTIYSSMTQDLLQARQLMQPAYPSTGRLRPNRYTADALLARAYLYNKQWSNAETRCDSILNSGLYALVSDLDNVFLDQSQEAIWQLGNSSLTYPKVAPTEGSPFTPILSFIAPYYSLSPFVIQAFDSGDLRQVHWVGSSNVGGVTYAYPYKYKNSIFSNPNNTAEDLMVFRLAEIYLIRAEARAQQGNFSGAMQDINLIRSRAGLGAVTAGDLPTAMGVILHERQTELFTEWGHRWFDLKRTDSINAVLGREKPWWPADGHAALYPIPYTDLLYNPELSQNPGY
jgi:hypothetical protein